MRKHCSGEVRLFGELGQTDAAREDYLKVCKFAPEDKAVAFAFAFAC